MVIQTLVACHIFFSSAQNMGKCPVKGQKLVSALPAGIALSKEKRGAAGTDGFSKMYEECSLKREDEGLVYSC
jgi:hypothetical protein